MKSKLKSRVVLPQPVPTPAPAPVKVPTLPNPPVQPTIPTLPSPPVQPTIPTLPQPPTTAAPEPSPLSPAPPNFTVPVVPNKDCTQGELGIEQGDNFKNDFSRDLENLKKDIGKNEKDPQASAFLEDARRREALKKDDVDDFLKALKNLDTPPEGTTPLLPPKPDQAANFDLNKQGFSKNESFLLPNTGGQPPLLPSIPHGSALNPANPFADAGNQANPNQTGGFNMSLGPHQPANSKVNLPVNPTGGQGEFNMSKVPGLPQQPIIPATPVLPSPPTIAHPPTYVQPKIQESKSDFMALLRKVGV